MMQFAFTMCSKLVYPLPSFSRVTPNYRKYWLQGLSYSNNMVQMILIPLSVYSACLKHKVTLPIICLMQISIDLKAGTFLYSESNLLCVLWLCAEFCWLLNDLSSCPNVPAVAWAVTNYLYLLLFIMSIILFWGREELSLNVCIKLQWFARHWWYMSSHQPENCLRRYRKLLQI